MNAATFEPEALLRRYPRVTPPERDALVKWLRALDARTLVSLLADRGTERQLLAVRAREPELQRGGVRLTVATGVLLVLAMAAGAAFVI